MNQTLADTLVFDLGMNNGDDTASYLAAGHRVVALEANPELAAAARHRFAPEISEGRLTILAQAIWHTPGPLTFFINTKNDHWSSLDAGWAGREDSACRPVEVQAVTLPELTARFGTPVYVKIDVEGVDQVVLDQIAGLPARPRYVSVEDCRFGFDYIETLAAAGYTGFKLLDQSQVPDLVDASLGLTYPPGSSGPFGENVPGPWLSYDAMLATYATTVRDRDGTRHAPRTHWWDIHATCG